METETTLPEKVNNWMKHSVTLKLISITILILLLLIPSSMVQSIITERELQSEDAISEVSAKWARMQLINGPILTVPLVYEKKIKDEEITDVTRYLHILPEQLKIDGQVNPEKLKRGIYEVVVYKSNLQLSGAFDLNQKIDPNGLKSIKWDAAFLTIGVSDLRGIKENILVNWDSQSIKAQPGTMIPDLIASGVTVYLPELNPQRIPDFQFELNLQGSENLSFVPLGSTTEVALSSPWPSPSFNGSFLPAERDVTPDGFNAQWKVLQLNRNFPQSWVGGDYRNSLQDASFGMDLILPLDDYQKSMRSAKYAIMTIGLTFLIFFLVEILNGQRIHAFQYTLVGLSLVLFYVLLISISEHANFNIAYSISTAAIVAMITLYSLSIFNVSKISLLLCTVLAGIYSFVFVTLQLADYALLLGSIGLTVTLAATMYFTRNVNWYQLKGK